MRALGAFDRPQVILALLIHPGVPDALRDSRRTTDVAGPQRGGDPGGFRARRPGEDLGDGLRASGIPQHRLHTQAFRKHAVFQIAPVRSDAVSVLLQDPRKQQHPSANKNHPVQFCLVVQQKRDSDDRADNGKSRKESAILPGKADAQGIRFCIQGFQPVQTFIRLTIHRKQIALRRSSFFGKAVELLGARQDLVKGGGVAQETQRSRIRGAFVSAARHPNLPYRAAASYRNRVFRLIGAFQGKVHSFGGPAVRRRRFFSVPKRKQHVCMRRHIDAGLPVGIVPVRRLRRRFRLRCDKTALRSAAEGAEAIKRRSGKVFFVLLPRHWQDGDQRHGET